MAFELKKAIERAREKGIEIKLTDLAEKLWPKSNADSQRINMYNLERGTTKNINPNWVDILCSELQCDANYLFNIEANEELEKES